MATKLMPALNRMFKNVFVCRSCGQKMRTDSLKVISKKITCRRCKGHVFRPVKAKKK